MFVDILGWVLWAADGLSKYFMSSSSIPCARVLSKASTGFYGATLRKGAASFSRPGAVPFSNLGRLNYLLGAIETLLAFYNFMAPRVRLLDSFRWMMLFSEVTDCLDVSQFFWKRWLCYTWLVTLSSRPKIPSMSCWIFLWSLDESMWALWWRPLRLSALVWTFCRLTMR